MIESVSLWSLVKDQADRTPDGLALEHPSMRLTYAELVSRSVEMSRRLAGAGVTHESVVALDLTPSPRTIVAMLAAGALGAAFLPIDPRESAPRRSKTLGISRPSAAVTDSEIVAVPEGELLERRLAMRDSPAAYVSFTSGSTGEPKGIVTEQHAIVNHVEQVRSAYGIGPGDRQLQFSSIAFDIAIDEIFSTLSSGATLVLRGQDFIFGNVVEFLEQCRRRQISILNLPTGLWNRLGAALADDLRERLPEDLRLVVVGGESARREAVDAWARASTHPHFQMLNAYGPTEAAVSVTLGALLPDRDVTIGRPLANVDIQLLDEEEGRLVHTGEVGEIVIGGTPVARGYLGSDMGGFGLLDEAWVYRTRDLGRLLPTGELAFLGRRDAQIKVRGGYRVEPAEVAVALQSHPAVAQAYVQAHTRGQDKVLLASVVPNGGVDVSALRSYAAETLPDWMVPWHVQSVEQIPLTDRGKVDESALAGMLSSEDEGAGSSAPDSSDDVSAAVYRAWASAVGAEPDGDDENFFEVGGDSLAALEFIETLSAYSDSAPSMTDFYRAPTVADVVRSMQPEALDEGIPTAHHTTGRTLVRMRRTGAGRLWCFLPPLSGAVTRYASMAAMLPAGEAVWAMETPASLSGGGMGRLAEGLAARLLEEDPSSFAEIVFSGYSLGGVFAHEVARRVEHALGDGPDSPTVCALLLDPPDPAEPQMSLDDAFDIFVRVGWRIPEAPSTFVSDGSYDLPAVAEAARRAGSLNKAAKNDELIDAWSVYANNARILDDYSIPVGVCRTAVLQCRDSAEVPPAEWIPGVHSGSWASVVDESDTSITGVEHFALMEPPNDRTVLRWLTETAERMGER